MQLVAGYIFDKLKTLETLNKKNSTTSLSNLNIQVYYFNQFLLKFLFALFNIWSNMFFLFTQRSGDLRSSPSQMFQTKDVPKLFAKFTEKHQCRSLFLIKMQVACNFIKTDSGIGNTPVIVFSSSTLL